MAVRFQRDRIEIDLADRRRVSVPLEFYPTLANASAAQRRHWEFWPMGTAVEWPELDLQLSVASIAAGRREHVPPAGFRERLEASARAAGVRIRPESRALRKAG